MKIDNNPFYDLSSELQNVHVCLKQSYEFANVHNYQEAERKIDDAFYYLGICKRLLHDSNLRRK